MSYILSQRSLNNLEGVNEILAEIVKRAIEITEQDFLVTEGLRTKEQCCINYGKGRTPAQCTAKGVPAEYARPNEAKVTQLRNPFNSRHTTGKAVDLAPYPVDWNDITKFEAIKEAMFKAAEEMEVTLTWGGDWKSLKDYPHFELA